MKNILIYYGWLNSFNSAENQWDNEKVAVDMSKYDLLVFGDGIQDPSHGDYANTQVIVSRIKTLNPSAKIFGYVTVNQDFSTFSYKVDLWDSNLAVHGIFLDEAGYDYGKTRADFNQRVDYVHSKVNSNLCIANAWNPDNVLGIVNDASYPNTTYNPTETASNLNNSDYILLESWPINTAAYVQGYEPAEDWKARGEKAQGLTKVFGVQFIASNVIDNNNANAASMCSFAATAASMYGIGVFGTSDTNYGSSSARVNYYPRLNVDYSGSPVTVKGNVYQKVIGTDCLKVDFTPSAETSSITDALDTGLTVVPAYGSLYSADLNQTLALTTTAIKFSLFNTAGVSKNVTTDAANDKFTVQVAGDYQVSFGLSSLVSTARDVQFHLRKNGMELPEFGCNVRALTTRTYVGFQNIGKFVTGDVLEIYVIASSGTNLTVWDTQLTLVKIG